MIRSFKLTMEAAPPGQELIEAGIQDLHHGRETIKQERRLAFLHYDFYAQALAKIERSHTTDLLDVHAMVCQRLIEPKRLVDFFLAIEDQLYRYPAIDGPSFRRAVERIARQQTETNR